MDDETFRTLERRAPEGVAGRLEFTAACIEDRRGMALAWCQPAGVAARRKGEIPVMIVFGGRDLVATTGYAVAVTGLADALSVADDIVRQPCLIVDLEAGYAVGNLGGERFEIGLRAGHDEQRHGIAMPEGAIAGLGLRDDLPRYEQAPDPFTPARAHPVPLIPMLRPRPRRTMAPTFTAVQIPHPVQPPARPVDRVDDHAGNAAPDTDLMVSAATIAVRLGVSQAPLVSLMQRCLAGQVAESDVRREYASVVGAHVDAVRGSRFEGGLAVFELAAGRGLLAAALRAEEDLLETLPALSRVVPDPDVILSGRTADEVARSLSETLPGFPAPLAEALSRYATGAATAEDVDKAFREMPGAHERLGALAQAAAAAARSEDDEDGVEAAEAAMRVALRDTMPKEV